MGVVAERMQRRAEAWAARSGGAAATETEAG